MWQYYLLVIILTILMYKFVEYNVNKMDMKMTYTDAAMECARYVFDSESEQESYQEHIIYGNDPRDHILYYAALVLGKEKDFETDINEYLNKNKDKIND